MKTISAIVPVYNEEKTVAHVINVLLTSGVFDEIICINDGSTDKSVVEISKFKNIKLIDYKINKGKGFAVATGIRKAKGDLIAMFDADLSTLNVDHVQKIIDPMLSDKSIDGVIAYESGEFLSLFSGQRVYKRRQLLPLLSEVKKSEYGVEVLLNAAFKDKNIITVTLSGLGHLEKLQKYETKVAVSNYLSQWFISVLGQCIKSGLTGPQLKSVITEIYNYMSNKPKKYLKSPK